MRKVLKMSAEQDKLKHSSRLHQDEVHIKKQTKIAKSHGIDVKEPHKFNKHHVTVFLFFLYLSRQQFSQL